jgi:hypothetical protein
MSEPCCYIEIGPDYQLHFYTVEFSRGSKERTFCQWDGKGFVAAQGDIFHDWLTRPEPGDEFELDGHRLTIVDIQTRFSYDQVLCMESSIAAHRLAQFNLLYQTQERVHWRLFFAQFDNRQLQRAFEGLWI